MYDPVEMIEILAVCIALAGIVCLPQLLAPVRPPALPKPVLEYSIYGDLIFPSDFYDWIHVQMSDESSSNLIDFGVLMTFHDAYIAPAAYKNFLSSHTLPDGTIAFRRVSGQFAISSAGLADRSCRLCSMASDLESANVAVKDKLQFGENRKWGFFHLREAQFEDMKHTPRSRRA